MKYLNGDRYGRLSLQATSYTVYTSIALAV